LNASVLLLDNVTKRFGDFTAVDGLSFAVPEGGVFGFLGGNGAGKTTSLRMALDIIRPTFGRIEVLGAPPSRENAAKIGFLPEERGLYRLMSVLDTVIYFGRLKRMDGGAARKAAMGLLERLGLQDRAATPMSRLSKGLAQKVQLATALVNAPKLLLLDEPFSGLDPVNQGVLEDVIRDLARGGATVLFSTHVMQHAERLCDRLLLLARGRRADPAILPSVISAWPLGAAEDGWVRFQVTLKPGADPGDLLEACTAQSFPLRGFDIHSPALHEVFIHLVGADQEIVR